MFSTWFLWSYAISQHALIKIWLKFVRHFFPPTEYQLSKTENLKKPLSHENFHFQKQSFKPFLLQFLFLTWVKKKQTKRKKKENKYVQNLKIKYLHFLLVLRIRFFFRGILFFPQNWKEPQTISKVQSEIDNTTSQYRAIWHLQHEIPTVELSKPIQGTSQWVNDAFQ